MSTINLQVEVIEGRENDLYDSMNEALRTLVSAGVVDDKDDAGWAWSAH